MLKIKNGGPAFPQNEWSHSGGDGREGMSLRDWFAGQALAGMLANQRGGLDPIAAHAEHAYLYADAMLAEREKQEAAE